MIKLDVKTFLNFTAYKPARPSYRNGFVIDSFPLAQFPLTTRAVKFNDRLMNIFKIAPLPPPPSPYKEFGSERVRRCLSPLHPFANFGTRSSYKEDELGD